METEIPSAKKVVLRPYNLDDALHWMCAHPLFAGDGIRACEEANAYRRPIGGTVTAADVARASSPALWTSALGLRAQRLLTNVYQNEFLFLPPAPDEVSWREFMEFYSAEMRVTSQIVRPAVEQLLFAFLPGVDSEAGEWPIDRCKEYLLDLPVAQAETQSGIVAAVLASSEPVRAVHNLLAQFAVDFLSEGSAIARKVMGNFGEVQSSLFQIFIDEYGGGIHQRKHSTLFERLLHCNGLDVAPGAYWNQCLAASFGVPALFQYLAANHSEFFRYVGAVYYAETAYYHFCRQISQMLRCVLGDDTETTYFDEHHEVDQKHSRIAFDSLVCPCIDRFGEKGARGIVLGYEAFRLVGDLFEQAFVNQLNAMDVLHEGETVSAKALRAGTSLAQCRKVAGVVSTSIVSDEPIAYLVRDGSMNVSFGLGAQTFVGRARALVVPKGVLHWVDGSDACTYEVASVGHG